MSHTHRQRLVRDGAVSTFKIRFPNSSLEELNFLGWIQIQNCFKIWQYNSQTTQYAQNGRWCDLLIQLPPHFKRCFPCELMDEACMHMDESCDTYGWVMTAHHPVLSLLMPITEAGHTHGCGMLHSTYMDESCHTYTWVVSHIGMRRVT